MGIDRSAGQKRVARGVPAGSQFSEAAHAEAVDAIREVPQRLSPVSWESHPWEPETGISKTKYRKTNRPHKSSIPPRIATWTPRVDGGIVNDVIEAERELARRLKASRYGPDNSHSRTLGRHSSSNARLVIGNVKAMEAALSLARRIGADTVLLAHRELLKSSDPPAGAGKFREEQVWIGGIAEGPHDAEFVPPHHGRVAGCLDDLFAYAARADISALAHAATFHAQFETIHPFTDGNGRTGRVIIHAMLAKQGLVRSGIVPISAGLLTNTNAYADALSAYREGDETPIISAFAEASIFAADRGRRLVDDLLAIREKNREAMGQRANTAAYQVNDLLIGHPVMTPQYAAQALGVSRRTAERAVGKLAEAGVVSESTKKLRDRVWQSDEVLQTLDEFADGIRRIRARLKG